MAKTKSPDKDLAKSTQPYRCPMSNRPISDELASVRRFCQTMLSGLTLSTGVASSEAFLLFQDRLWGVRFSMGSYQAKWQLGADQVLLFEEGRLIDRLSVREDCIRRAA
jgi:hypothetical protein